MSVILVTLAAYSFMSCSVKNFDPNDSSASFSSAHDTYKDGNYEMAINELREFIARFPYSEHTATAELLIANSYYELAQYEDAVFEYEQFLKLHPNHQEVEFVMFRIGDCYWREAPEDIDREQEFTRRAIAEWQKLVKKFSSGKYTSDANKKMEEGWRRIAENEQFIAQFYCKRKIFHACASRYMNIIQKFGRYSDIKKNAQTQAARAFGRLAMIKTKHPDKIDNLFLKDYSAAQLSAKAKELLKNAEEGK